MSKFIGYQPCPKCQDRGRDNAGDNLAIYDDGSAHCFSCGFHRHPKHYVRKPDEEVRTEDKARLPSDFSREVPVKAWKWLLQYGLGLKYWTPYCGYSEKDERLIITVGTPIDFSIGRYFGDDEGIQGKRKWWCYGDAHKASHICGTPETSGSIVLVEDIVSAHKVGQITSCIPLFGTNIFDSVVSTLRLYKKPVIMWLDKDQQDHARKRAARLAMLTGCEVSYVFSDSDPKELSFEKIKGVLK